MWVNEYERALNKADMHQEDIETIINDAARVVALTHEPYRARLVSWLNKQSRDDFMVSGGVWQDLLTTIFDMND